MPRYYSFKIADHYLYFTSQFVIEAMHEHAIGKNLSEARSARFFIKGNGDIVLRKQGTLNGRQMVIIRIESPKVFTMAPVTSNY